MDPQRLRRMVASARAGRTVGYKSLLETYGPRLYGYFLRATGRHEDAEDLLSEVTLRLVRRLQEYDERGRFDHWLFRIAANVLRDRIRRAKAAPNLLSLAADQSDGARTEPPARHKPVDSRLLAAEQSASLQQALDRLDGATREMILLRYFAEMSFKELSEMYQCPLGTVLARVHRGIRTLREFMGTEHGPE